MKKKKVTYGVSGMMEFQAIIKIGRSAMKVLFTDGSMNAMGENPATYTTDNLMVQHAIENSDHFKRGRIHVVRTVLLDEDVHIDRNPKRETPLAPPLDPAPVNGDQNAPEETATQDAGEESQSEEEVQEATEEAADETPAPTPITEMEFDNNDDAKDFLETQFGFVRSKLHNRTDIVAAGETHGIRIIFV